MTQKITTIITDFDGVMTNNEVYVLSNGIEAVSCSRADGLAIDGIKKIGIEMYIFSTEKNIVVKERGTKLGLKTHYAIKNKKKLLLDFENKNLINFENTLYVGNDINDIDAMTLCKYSACPADSSERVKQIATWVLETKGGKGIFREVVEKILNLDLYEVLYNND